jgi:hypothetical protein
MVGASMLRRAASLAFAATLLAAPGARAGTAACWIDNGAVVVPAAFGHIAGDFILDLSSPVSLLHYDVATGDGIDGDAATGVLRVAGERIATTLKVASIDARAVGMPTTLNGVIGADVLARYVVDLQFAPCRLTLRRRAAPMRAGAVLPVTLVGGVPTVVASVSDGHAVATGPFAIDTDALGLRFSAAAAHLSRASAAAASRRAPPARLAALSLADRVFEATPAGIDDAAPAGVLGEIGTAVWSRFGELRLDLRRRRLWLKGR